MAEEEHEHEVPEGSAVLPDIPDDLDVHPLLLATLHAVVFIAGSDENLVHPGAGAEALEHVGAYLRRLGGRELERVKNDLAALADFAKQQEWGKEEVELFTNFLSDFGSEEDSDD
jgi:hypothetical protein